MGHESRSIFVQSAYGFIAIHCDPGRFSRHRHQQVRRNTAGKNENTTVARCSLGILLHEFISDYSPVVSRLESILRSRGRVLSCTVAVVPEQSVFALRGVSRSCD
jgi:hypothetical protein